MTQNQIRWFEANEQVKHNRATETEAQRHNLVMEDQGQQEISEKVRSNITNEGIKSAQLAEQIRAAHVNEDISWANLTETERKNRANEQLGFHNLNESIRSHLENERVAAQTLVENVKIKYSELDEKIRHDLATEKIDKQQADTQLTKVRNDFQIELERIAENFRHNVATELETKRSDLAKERQALYDFKETQRHNFETEKAKDYELQIKSLEEAIKRKEADVKVAQHNLDVTKFQSNLVMHGLDKWLDIGVGGIQNVLGIAGKIISSFA